MASRRVTGIGGIFFKSKDPAGMREWYGKHLGFKTDTYGANFETRRGDQPGLKASCVWAPFADNTKYFAPSTKEFMINFRVDNLAGLVGDLRKNGVQILDEIAEYEYGKFVHILDPEGNKVELWEPPEGQ